MQMQAERSTVSPFSCAVTTASWHEGDAAMHSSVVDTAAIGSATHLVNEVDTGLGGQVAQQVERPVEVEHDADLPSHAVVEAPGAVVVHEGVPHPKACMHTVCQGPAVHAMLAVFSRPHGVRIRPQQVAYLGLCPAAHHSVLRASKEGIGHHVTQMCLPRLPTPPCLEHR